jgi:alkanesulfonate monooxygenase SsuD/methylene tetrahydromethanopterin reductase-like flavin-dependent oxidoreductase (luciferase family)
MRAVGVPMEHRGSRADEYLEAMVALWTQERPAYAGRFVSFRGVNAYPRPVQRPHPPVVVGGGRSPAAYRRAVRYGRGWYGYNLSPEEAARHLEGLREAAQRERRPLGLGELEISVTPRGPVDAAAVRSYADLGVHRLILNPPRADAPAVEEFVARMSSLA